MLTFMAALLCSRRRVLKKRIKDWFRAYLNLGLLHHVQGKPRPMACGAGADTFFLDPWGQIIACNGSERPLVMGDLKTRTFDEIWHGNQAQQVRKEVETCNRACWMTGTAVPAMRRNPWKPLQWVIKNKLRLAMGKPICV